MKNNKSFYTYKHQTYLPITNNIQGDIVIIGGGLTGITLAYLLNQTNKKVILLESQTLGSGASGHNTGKVTFMHDTMLHQLKERYGMNTTKLYYRANVDAIAGIKEIITKHHIDCDYQEVTHYLYTNDVKKIKELEKERQIYHQLSIETINQRLHNTKASLGVKNQIIFNPVKYLYGLVDLCSNIYFYEHSKVTKVTKHKNEYYISVNNHTVRCKQVIYATRYPFFYKHPYFMILDQSRDYLQYTLTNQHNYALLSLDKDGYSYRSYHKGGIEVNREYQWYNIDTMSLRLLPYISKIPHNQEYIAFGYNKWGNSNSYVAGKLLYDLIMKQDNPYKDIFSLSFHSDYISKGAYLKYWTNSATSMITGHFKKDIVLSKLKNDEGVVTRVKGKLVAVYKDKDGKYHYYSPYCPHLKCIVKYNKQSHCFECPCHKSIYNSYGKVLNGPSKNNLKEIKISK